MDTFRGDTDFSQTSHVDRWHAQGVRFVFGYDARANVIGCADALHLMPIHVGGRATNALVLGLVVCCRPHPSAHWIGDCPDRESQSSSKAPLSLQLVVDHILTVTPVAAAP
jgi:hypothetical protein